MSDAFLNAYHLKTSEELVNKMVTTDSRGRHIDNEHLDIGNAPAMSVPRNLSTGQDDFSMSRITRTNPVSIKQAMTFDKENLASLKSGSMLTDPESMLTNRFNNFSRYGYLDPTHELLSGAKEFIFFSKPDLHLMDRDGNGGVVLNPQLAGNPFFKEAFKHYRYSFYSLQQWYGNGSAPFLDFDSKNKFIPLLSNMVTSSFDLPDISANEVQGNQNLYQVNTSYREGSITADLQYDFSLEFKDTKYLDVYMLFKIYDEYHRHKYEENVKPNRSEYSLYRIVPEAFSVWKVIVDDTGRIIFWAKATGVTAMSVPRGTLSNLEGTVKFTINFKAQFIKDMDPVHLMELNNLTNMSLYNNKNYIFCTDISRENWVGYPIIRMQSKTGALGSDLNSFVRTGDADTEQHRMYRLMWISPQQ